MELSYEQILAITRSWDGIYFLAVFAVACAYALWPSNREKFRDAAAIPLRDDEDA